MDSRLFTPDIIRRLRANGDASMRCLERIHHRPVVKLFNPYGQAVWLLSEIDLSAPDHVHGLCDLGHGRPTLGWVSREGLETAYIQRGAYRLPLERDAAFAPRHTMAVYARAARLARAITENADALDAAAASLADPPGLWIDWPATG